MALALAEAGADTVSTNGSPMNATSCEDASGDIQNGDSRTLANARCNSRGNQKCLSQERYDRRRQAVIDPESQAVDSKQPQQGRGRANATGSAVFGRKESFQARSHSKSYSSSW